MNNENEKIIKLLSGINAAQNEMISAVSHRTGHNAEETAVLLRIFDLGSIAKIPADEIPEHGRDKSRRLCRAYRQGCNRRKGNEHKP